MLKDYIKEKNWIFENENNDAAEKLSLKLGLPKLTASAVLNRGGDNIDGYVNPDKSLF